MTGEMWAILGVGVTAISITSGLLMSINNGIHKMCAMIESRFEIQEIRIKNIERKLDNLNQ